MPLENSAQTAQDPSPAVPLAEAGEGTAGEVAGKAKTREEKALNALKKADVEGNEAETEGNEAEPKTKKAETEGNEAEPKLLADLCFPNFLIGIQ